MFLAIAWVIVFAVENLSYGVYTFKKLLTQQ